MVSLHLAAILAVGLGTADGGPTRDEYVVESRSFAIPVRVDDEWVRKGGRVHLYVSSDAGASWRLHEVASGPGVRQVNFVAPQDGRFWFTSRGVDADGKFEPPVSADAAQLKVWVTGGRAAARPATNDDAEVAALREEFERVRTRLADVKRRRAEAIRNEIKKLQQRLAELERSPDGK